MVSRACCDRQCQTGKPCAGFAPGVIEGPYRRSVRRKAALQARDTVEGLLGALLLFWDYLKGPRP